MKKVACIIQARLGSTRLPAKVLLPLPTGRTVLEEVIYRCRQIEGVDVVVVAIPDTNENDILVPFIEKSRDAVADLARLLHDESLLDLKVTPVELFRGPEHDVLKRYAMAAEAVGATTIMRVTSDCPLLNVNQCRSLLLPVTIGPAAYATNAWPNERTAPGGWDCEVFSAEILQAADAEATLAYDREHVTPWMQKQRDGTRFLTCRSTNDRHPTNVRWTLDTLEDYVRIWGVFEGQRQCAAVASSPQAHDDQDFVDAMSCD